MKVITRVYVFLHDSVEGKRGQVTTTRLLDVIIQITYRTAVVTDMILGSRSQPTNLVNIFS